MNVPLWVLELADAFWAAAGGPAAFPRDLRGPALAALFLPTRLEASLTLGSLRGWLAERHIPWPADEPDRPLCACLVVRREAGLIFLDAGDDEAERRFSLAHEVAHFLRHYRQPRERARRLLGDEVLGVFDGERAPLPGERLRAALADVPLGFHVHLMTRDERGRARGAVSTAEAEADRLAYELLAPAESVAARLSGADDRKSATNTLQEIFGLPGAQARAYAAELLPEPASDPLFDWLTKKS